MLGCTAHGCVSTNSRVFAAHRPPMMLRHITPGLLAIIRFHRPARIRPVRRLETFNGLCPLVPPGPLGNLLLALMLTSALVARHDIPPCGSDRPGGRQPPYPRESF